MPLLAIISLMGVAQAALKADVKRGSLKKETTSSAASTVKPLEKATTAELLPASGKTMFKAVGRPSALKIIGEGPGPSGQVKVTEGQLRGVFIVDLNGLDTGVGLRTRHMKEKYLEVGKFPRATLILTQAALPAADVSQNFKYEKLPFLGTLSLHGVDKPVSGTADIERTGKNVKVSAGFDLKLTDYGIEIPKYVGITVAEDVTVSIESSSVVQE